jgi:hypothetical protein
MALIQRVRSRLMEMNYLFSKGSYWRRRVITKATTSRIVSITEMISHLIAVRRRGHRSSYWKMWKKGRTI